MTTTHTHTPSHTNPYYTSSSTFNAYDSYSSRKLGRNTGYRVNPQQFAPRTTGRSQFPTGYPEYNTPPTPPVSIAFHNFLFSSVHTRNNTLSYTCILYMDLYCAFIKSHDYHITLICKFSPQIDFSF